MNEYDLKTRIEVLESNVAAIVIIIHDLQQRATEADMRPADQQPAMPGPDGLYGKYRILKADTGKPVEGDYFVLKLVDRHSWMALRAYAMSVVDENEELANDIHLLVRKHEREAHERSYMQGKEVR